MAVALDDYRHEEDEDEEEEEVEEEEEDEEEEVEEEVEEDDSGDTEDEIEEEEADEEESSEAKNTTITITFGDQAENHVGMQIIGAMHDTGFTLSDMDQAQQAFTHLGCQCEMVNLNNALPDVPR
eukprot:TRINITY_DN2111_c0_g1_i2.p3 TRINITY_DN2111_c0_g1~~TRINITY_DN2111_c0_g1_i2.p3  ORF type:complete len:125 (+),score=56.32 TRINITY_DN2111_c0_g1_i2:690-1064(+)